MKSAAVLREAAQRYRRMAKEIADRQTIEALEDLAAECEAAADKLDRMHTPQPPGEA
jgi:hypothetical protein